MPENYAFANVRIKPEPNSSYDDAPVLLHHNTHPALDATTRLMHTPRITTLELRGEHVPAIAARQVPSDVTVNRTPVFAELPGSAPLVVPLQPLGGAQQGNAMASGAVVPTASTGVTCSADILDWLQMYQVQGTQVTRLTPGMHQAQQAPQAAGHGSLAQTEDHNVPLLSYEEMQRLLANLAAEGAAPSSSSGQRPGLLLKEPVDAPPLHHSHAQHKTQDPGHRQVPGPGQGQGQLQEPMYGRSQPLAGLAAAHLALAQPPTADTRTYKYYTPEEDQVIHDMVQHGWSWEDIAARLGGRTAESVKGRWARTTSGAGTGYQGRGAGAKRPAAEGSEGQDAAKRARLDEAASDVQQAQGQGLGQGQPLQQAQGAAVHAAEPALSAMTWSSGGNPALPAGAAAQPAHISDAAGVGAFTTLAAASPVPRQPITTSTQPAWPPLPMKALPLAAANITPAAAGSGSSLLPAVPCTSIPAMLQAASYTTVTTGAQPATTAALAAATVGPGTATGSRPNTHTSAAFNTARLPGMSSLLQGMYMHHFWAKPGGQDAFLHLANAAAHLAMAQQLSRSAQLQRYAAAVDLHMEPLKLQAQGMYGCVLAGFPLSQILPVADHLAKEASKLSTILQTALISAVAASMNLPA